METHFRTAKNNKPPSTWKTGLTREKRMEQDKEKDSKAVPTVDLSKMDQKLGGAEAPIPTIDGTNKAEQAAYNQIMKKWRLNRLKRKGLVVGDVEKAKENFLK